MGEAEIVAWLRREVAQLLGQDPEEVDIDEELARYGLDSLAAVSLSGELADWLDRPVPPTIAWDYPTIRAIARALAGEPGDAPAPAPRAAPVAAPGAIRFSLSFFSSRDDAGDPYRLLREAARFADAHDFEAIWTPERHFHAFGGPFPSPAVLGGALAVLTRRIRIRAGSVVLPLHHPVRVVEEWSVVDQLSGGRVDLAFAAGWSPRDFVFAPERHAGRREALVEGIAQVRALWRGEPWRGPGGEGEVEVRPRPAPVQRELPVWLTCASSDASFVEAGRIGANVLTGLFFQTVEELAARIRLYREARAAAGHDPGRVTLTIHTFVAETEAEALEAVRAPFLAYLESSVDLWRQGSAALDALDAAQRAEVLAYAFERYRRTAALFGTPETCLARVRELSAAGVDELACLVDFGVDEDRVLAALPALARLVDRARGETIVRRFYDGLAQTPTLPDRAWLTFGMLSAPVPGFSWLRALLEPAAAPDATARAVDAQARLRDWLFAGLDLAGARVLDLGSGYGTDLLELAARHPDLYGEGSTLSPAQARIAAERAARRGIDRVRFAVRDNAELGDGPPFDAVLAFEVAVYAEDKDRLFAAVRRRLRPGGRMLLAELVAHTEHTASLAEISSFMPTRVGWADLFARHGLRVRRSLDVSEEVAHFLDDPAFERHLADLSATLALDPLLVTHFRAQDRFGRALAQRLAGYLLLELELVGGDEATLRAANLALLPPPRRPTVYAVPHGGGTAQLFAGWSVDGAAVVGVDLPGRGARRDEPALERMEAVLDALPAVDGPCVLFGHSLGALVAWEWAHRLRARGVDVRGLVVSSCAAPGALRAFPSPDGLDDDALLAALGREGLLPTGDGATLDEELAPLLQAPEGRARLFSALRADLRLLHRYRPTARPPLSCPVLALGGADDAFVPREALAAWGAHTRGSFEVRQLPGGHFYLRSARRAVLAALAELR